MPRVGITSVWIRHLAVLDEMLTLPPIRDLHVPFQVIFVTLPVSVPLNLSKDFIFGVLGGIHWMLAPGVLHCSVTPDVLTLISIERLRLEAKGLQRVSVDPEVNKVMRYRTPADWG